MFDCLLMATGLEAGAIIAIISGVTAAAGTAVSVQQSRAAGEAADKTAKFNAQVESNNAQAAAEQAQAQATQVRRINRLRLGSQRAATAKSGVDLSGSSADIFTDTAQQGELQALSELYAGQREASFYQSQGQAQRFEGQTALQASRYRAGSSLISGAASGVNIYANYAKTQPSFRSSRTQLYNDYGPQ